MVIEKSTWFFTSNFQLMDILLSYLKINKIKKVFKILEIKFREFKNSVWKILTTKSKIEYFN